MTAYYRFRGRGEYTTAYPEWDCRTYSEHGWEYRLAALREHQCRRRLAPTAAVADGDFAPLTAAGGGHAPRGMTGRG
jgi:hypothetical protein